MAGQIFRHLVRQSPGYVWPGPQAAEGPVAQVGPAWIVHSFAASRPVAFAIFGTGSDSLHARGWTTVGWCLQRRLARQREPIPDPADKNRRSGMVWALFGRDKVFSRGPVA